jgi:phytol kinase
MYIEIGFSIVAIFYAMAIVIVTKSTYEMMRKRGSEEMVAVYYNRKIVHMAAGGVVALAVPFLFDSWIYPLVIGLALTAFTVLPRLQGKPMDFMQTKENWNDTKFTLMWGISIAVMWIIFNNPFIAVIPTLFMAFGDAVTGVVRNALYKKRTKSPVGNIFMLVVCVVIGYFLVVMAETPSLNNIGTLATMVPLWGVLAAVVASVIERFEIGPIDDNILITVSTMAVLIIGSLIV